MQALKVALLSGICVTQWKGNKKINIPMILKVQLLLFFR